MVRQGGNGHSVQVRPGEVGDEAFAARLHAERIADGFLARMGPAVLEPLYRRIARSESAFLLMAEDGGGPVGFIAGSTSTPRLYRDFLRRDGLRVALRAGPRLLARAPQVLETWRQGSRQNTPQVSGQDSPQAQASRPGSHQDSPQGSRQHSRRDRPAAGTELLAVAVVGSAAGRGVGRLLVEAFLEEAGRRRAPAAHVVVGAGNAPAIALYEAAGFVTADRLEVHRGTPSILMVRDEPAGPPAPERTTACR